jgi:hypothetical protein
MAGLTEGRVSLNHCLVMQMVAMVSKVVYLSFHSLLDLGGALGCALEPLSQAP